MDKLKKFGITMGAAFLAITAIFSLKHRHIIMPALLISLAFFALAALAPRLLKPVYSLWMKLAHFLSWVNTRVILSIIFYLIFLPIGLFMKLFRIDPLGRKIEKGRDSYWHKKESRGFSVLDYERQF